MKIPVSRILLVAVAGAMLVPLAILVLASPPDPGALVGALAEMFSRDWAFPRHSAMALLTVATMWFAAAGLGHLAISRFAAGRLPGVWARWVLAPLIGWVVLGLATLATGLAGFFSFQGLGAVLLLASALAVRGWTAWWRETMSDVVTAIEALEANEDDDGPDPVETTASAARAAVRFEARAGRFHLNGWVLLAGIALYAIGIPYAITPAVESDELRYHLAAPEAWLETGRIAYLPNQAFSNFPFLVEMLYSMAMALQGTEAARLVHFTFLESAATLVGLLAFLLIRVAWSAAGGRAVARRNARTPLAGRARELAGVIAGIAAVAFAAIPTATVLACWGFNDLAMTAWFLAIAYLGALFLVSRDPPPAWIAGVMAGGCLGTKYSMAPLLLGVFALLALCRMLVRSSASDRAAADGRAFPLGRIRRSAWAYLAVAAWWATVAGGPWFAKSFLFTGNPVYPLAWSVFGGGDWSDECAKFYAAKAAEKGYGGRELADELRRDGGSPPAWLAGPAAPAIGLAISPLAVTFRPGAFEGHFLGPIPLMAMFFLAGGLLLGPARRLIRKGLLGDLLEGVVVDGVDAVDLADTPAETPTPPGSSTPSTPSTRSTPPLPSSLFPSSPSDARLAELASRRRALVFWIAGLIVGSWLFWFFTYQASRLLLPAFGVLLAAAAWGAWRLLSGDDSAFGRRLAAGVAAAGIAYSLIHVAVEVHASDRHGHAPRVAFGFESREDYLTRRVDYYDAARRLAELVGPGRGRALLLGEHRTLYFPQDVIASDWFDQPQPLDFLRRTWGDMDLIEALRANDVRYVLLNRGELSKYARRYFQPRFSVVEFMRFEYLTGFGSGDHDPALRPIWPETSESEAAPQGSPPVPPHRSLAGTPPPGGPRANLPPIVIFEIVAPERSSSRGHL